MPTLSERIAQLEHEIAELRVEIREQAQRRYGGLASEPRKYCTHCQEALSAAKGYVGLNGAPYHSQCLTEAVHAGTVAL